ncbi:RHO GTPase-activating protein RGD1 [Diplogelasinospora grovesii]|uniref:RHO GTPase-activating protein RGD1 n=1 Tax=Diplogelasinospora grovesii TaxID=303347 RepID=A0AAN6NB66_9PEZI|nr:RHO GTPase-activating protein RGD1 [Diplogelasinospora grovesii]
MSGGEAVKASENEGPSNANLGLTSPTTAPATAETTQQVKDVLESEIGVSVMLNRLKQSIASAKEFALFLKERARLEDDHANKLRKVCRSSQDNIQRPEYRGGSFSRAFTGMLEIHERMADNEQQFASSLHQMHEDLLELAAIAEKSRKGWKQSGLAAEQKVAQLEEAMRKSKAKYDSLVEEYDRARTGDTSGQLKGAKMFGFKGPKSAAQHEEDLLRKAQAADQDYMVKVQAVQTERGELLSKTRPETVRALQDIVKECDAGLAMQIQKFASFNEKLLLSNGISISPLKKGPGEMRSLRECVAAIDNDKDLNEYLSSHHSKVLPKTGEIKYERNPILDAPHRVPTGPINASQQAPALGSVPNNSRTAFTNAPLPVQDEGPMGHAHNQSMGPGPMMPAIQRPSSQPSHERSHSHGIVANQNIPPQGQQYMAPHPHRGSMMLLPQTKLPGPKFIASLHSTVSQRPPQLGTLAFQAPEAGPSNPLQQHPVNGPGYHSPSNGLPQRASYSPPAMPARAVFGVSLMTLYERDNSPVPMVVCQCMQAVELFGLSVEGIYRLSGTVSHINKLKNMFDNDSSPSSIDFRNPENFFHDVNSVAGLLKQFFRELPDPLLTREHYPAFIEAAKNDDPVIRRDSLHAIINSLPDTNYATLRSLALHLYRVMENSSVNRMISQNLGIVFGPTLLGPSPGSNIADAGWQARVVDTILQNVYSIFDDDG